MREELRDASGDLFHKSDHANRNMQHEVGARNYPSGKRCKSQSNGKNKRKQKRFHGQCKKKSVEDCVIERKKRDHGNRNRNDELAPQEKFPPPTPLRFIERERGGKARGQAQEIIHCTSFRDSGLKGGYGIRFQRAERRAPFTLPFYEYASTDSFSSEYCTLYYL